ncbi:MAG: 30S ribosomal protein S27e [archaeon]|jgi:small subunit ribosomal protein S27e|nr:30S ribosomal protein S27e [archaeon]
MANTRKNPRSKFLRIVCPRCKKQKTVFGKATTLVKCEGCNYLLLQTKGGKSKIRAPIKEVLWK